jgi:hypothetical protein
MACCWYLKNLPKCSCRLGIVLLLDWNLRRLTFSEGSDCEIYRYVLVSRRLNLLVGGSNFLIDHVL